MSSTSHIMKTTSIHQIPTSTPEGWKVSGMESGQPFSHLFPTQEKAFDFIANFIRNS